jgi:hypothetical protein
VSNVSREIMTSDLSRHPSPEIAQTRVDLVESLLTGPQIFASGKSTEALTFSMDLAGIIRAFMNTLARFDDALVLGKFWANGL